MKKIFCLSVVMLFLAVSFESNAQVRAGAGFLFGTLTDDFGINLNGEYLFSDRWSAETHVSIFFVEDISDPLIGDLNQGLWMIDFDAHYHFLGGKGGPYALAGLNLSTGRVEFAGESTSDTDVGLNIGGGYIADLGGRVMPFADVRYIISNADQLVIRAGAKYSF
jgi:hypothetical protein